MAQSGMAQSGTARPGVATEVAGIDTGRLAAFAAREAGRFAQSRPESARRMQEAASYWLGGVPMHWMNDWPMPHLPVVRRAWAARIADIDGHTLDDFCLGDTGSMFGHSPSPVARAIREQSRRGLTYMLPPDNAAEAGRLLAERFGPFHWQVATTASDANRFAIRVARAVTGRSKILVFNGCYHGAVDETFVERVNGRTVPRAGLLGQTADLSKTTVCCEFNDLTAIEAALRQGDVAAILAEPVMTNCAMVLPDPGFHDSLRALATRYGALLIIDETHTISTGQGGYTGVHGLSPDIFVVGKCVAGGMPAAVWGLGEDVAQRLDAVNAGLSSGYSGMGTTLSANPMQLACLVANLSQVMTPDNHAVMEAGAARLAAGLGSAVARHQAPWHVIRVGARVEFICAPGPLRNGAEAMAAHRPAVERAVHLGLLNRGSLIAPFHNMMLVSPVTGARQIDRLVAGFDAVLAELFA